MATINDVDWIIIDWGTTNFRAFAMRQEGTLVSKIEKNLGLLQVADGKFSQVLETVLQQWLGEYRHLPVYMAGMVGSSQGWIDVPYIKAPANAQLLAQHRHQFLLPWGAVAIIIPGVSYLSESDDYEVMRGEEVQLIGLQTMIASAGFTAVLPGTHSKHVLVQHNMIARFKTYMTGELFSLLAKHSILGRALRKQINADDAFLKGVEKSGGCDFSSKLFSSRTQRLLGNLAEEEVLDYLSGLLIGQELKSLSASHLYLVGGSALCTRYQKACAALQLSSKFIHGDDSFLAGMIQIKRIIDDDQ